MFVCVACCCLALLLEEEASLLSAEVTRALGFGVWYTMLGIRDNGQWAAGYVPSMLFLLHCRQEIQHVLFWLLGRPTTLEKFSLGERSTLVCCVLLLGTILARWFQCLHQGFSSWKNMSTGSFPNRAVYRARRFRRCVCVLILPWSDTWRGTRVEKKKNNNQPFILEEATHICSWFGWLPSVGFEAKVTPCFSLLPVSYASFSNLQQKIYFSYNSSTLLCIQLDNSAAESSRSCFYGWTFRNCSTHFRV